MLSNNIVCKDIFEKKGQSLHIVNNLRVLDCPSDQE